MEPRKSLEDLEEIPAVGKQTKLDNTKSKFSKQKELLSDKEAFVNRANSVSEQMQNTKLKALELTKQYWEVIHDQTLSDNKGPLQKSLEKEILSNLAKYALELNQDPPPGSDEIRPQGYGSIAMVNLLFKSVLYFRDKNNDLEYKVAQLEKQVKLLSSQEKNA